MYCFTVAYRLNIIPLRNQFCYDPHHWVLFNLIHIVISSLISLYITIIDLIANILWMTL